MTIEETIIINYIHDRKGNIIIDEEDFRKFLKKYNDLGEKLIKTEDDMKEKLSEKQQELTDLKVAYIKLNEENEKLNNFELTRLRSENEELKEEVERLKKLEQANKEEQFYKLFDDYRLDLNRAKSIIEELRDKWNFFIEDVECNNNSEICINFSCINNREVGIHAFINASGHFDANVWIHGDFDFVEYSCIHYLIDLIRETLEMEAMLKM